jgi:hypothetical protein
MPTHMPHRFEKSAPQFDPTNPRSLLRYFADLDYLFTQHQVSDDQQRKRHACTYLDIDSEDLWRLVPEYKPPATFATFKTAIFTFYPGANDEYRVSDMEKLVADQARAEIESADDLGAYYRRFIAITSSLLESRRISTIFANRAFVNGFQPPLWERIHRRLREKLPDHFWDDPYDTEIVYEAGLFVFHCAHVSTSSVSAQPAISSSSASLPSPSSSHQEFFDRFFNSLSSTIASTIRRHPPPIPSTPAPIVRILSPPSHTASAADPLAKFEQDVADLQKAPVPEPNPDPAGVRIAKLQRELDELLKPAVSSPVPSHLLQTPTPAPYAAFKASQTSQDSTASRSGVPETPKTSEKPRVEPAEFHEHVYKTPSYLLARGELARRASTFMIAERSPPDRESPDINPPPAALISCISPTFAHIYDTSAHPCQFVPLFSTQYTSETFGFYSRFTHARSRPSSGKDPPCCDEIT